MSRAKSSLVQFLKLTFGWLNKRVRVSKVEPLTERFVQIELSGEPLKKLQWNPGSKIQIDVTGEFTFRTYTPTQMNLENGTISLIVYRRPGNLVTEWIDRLKPGAACDVFGPRDSLNLSGLSGRVAVFGDETSIGIASVLKFEKPDDVENFFEAHSIDELGLVLKKLEMKAFALQREEGDQQINKLAERIITMNKESAFRSIFLTGRAKSIQKLRHLLKESGIEPQKMKARPYWADGRSGLD